MTTDEGTERQGKVRSVLTLGTAPEPRGPYPHARVQDGLVWVTGQIGRDPATGSIVDGGFDAEFDQAITNLAEIVRAAGSELADVLWTQVQFVREADLDAMNRIYAERFGAARPARTSFGAAFLWKGALVQISAVAACVPREQES